MELYKIKDIEGIIIREARRSIVEITRRYVNEDGNERVKVRVVDDNGSRHSLNGYSFVGSTGTASMEQLEPYKANPFAKLSNYKIKK